PLAGAKKLQRETMAQIHERYGAITARLCYPAMATTALGAIPGGILMFALTAEILKERGEYQTLMELAVRSMPIFTPEFKGEDVRLDEAYQATLPEFYRRRDALTPDNVARAF